MVFEMPIGIHGFVIAVTSINVCPGIGRVVDDCKDAAVGQSPPGNLSIPGTSISTFREGKVVFGEIPDNTISAPCNTERLEKCGDRMPDFFVGIHDSSAVRIIDVTDRERKTQFTPGSGIFLAADHTGAEEMKFRFPHGAFQSNKETVIKIGHIVDTVFIDHKGAEQPTKLKELHEVG